MDFGKIPEKELLQTDFTLPPDPPENKEVLKRGKGKTKFYIGCAKWGRKDWIGKLYPQGTKEKDFLEFRPLLLLHPSEGRINHNLSRDRTRRILYMDILNDSHAMKHCPP